MTTLFIGGPADGQMGETGSATNWRIPVIKPLTQALQFPDPMGTSVVTTNYTLSRFADGPDSEYCAFIYDGIPAPMRAILDGYQRHAAESVKLRSLLLTALDAALATEDPEQARRKVINLLMPIRDDLRNRGVIP